VTPAALRSSQTWRVPSSHQLHTGLSRHRRQQRRWQHRHRCGPGGLSAFHKLCCQVHSPKTLNLWESSDHATPPNVDVSSDAECTATVAIWCGADFACRIVVRCLQATR